MGFGQQIASLFASIGVDTKPLEKGLGSAGELLKKFAGEMAKNVIGTVSLAGAIYKTGQAVITSATEWADYADSLRLASQMAGITTEEMSRLVQAADDFRVPMETMQRSMEMALKNGFTPTIDNLADLSDDLLSIEDPAKRATEASKIFGKSYADMMPFLLAGGDAIRGATEAVSDSLIVTEEGAAEAKAYKDQVDALGDAWTGLRNKAGMAVLPIMIEIVKYVEDVITVDDTEVNVTYENLNKKSRSLRDEAIDDLELMNKFFGMTDMEMTDARLHFYDGTMSVTQEIEYAQGIIDDYNKTMKVAAQGTDDWASANYDFSTSHEVATESVRVYTEAELALIDAYEAVKAAEEEAQAALKAEIEGITSLSANYNGIIDLAYEYTNMLEEKEGLQIERQKLLSQGWSEQSTKVKELTDNIAGLDADMKRMADQVTLDMMKATIAVGGVTQAELAAYMQMAVDMGYMSEEGAKAAIEAYSNAFKTIDGYKIDEKTGNVRIDALAAFATLDLLQQYQLLDKPMRILVSTHYGTWSEGNYDPYENYTGPQYPHGGGASGGYFMADTPYIVGERGPELFVPNANGQVIPNNELGGGNSELLGDILLELQNQPSRMKVAIKEAFALVGG